MNTFGRSLGYVFWAGSLAVCVAGCAGLPVPDEPGQDLTEKREQRQEEVVSQFEAKREFAEFQAAVARWNQHDLAGCEETLRKLLDRNPDHRDARLLLADVYLASNRQQDAFAQVEAALAAHPDDARVQYTMGLLLDSMGQRTGALAYYGRAAKQEPENELYTISYLTASEDAQDGRVPAAGQASPACEKPACSEARVEAPVAPQAALEAPTCGAVPPGSSRLVARVPDPTERGLESLLVRGRNNPSTTRAASAAGHSAPGYASAGSASAPGPSPPPSPELVRVAHAEPIEQAKHAGPADAHGYAERADFDQSDPGWSLLQHGRAALAEGNAPVALAYFREAAGSSPQNPQIPISAAVTALEHNHPEVAIELMQGARRHFTRSAQIPRILGVAHYRLGDYRSSQVALQQALSLDKSSALTYFLMGCTLTKLGQLEPAEAHFRQARTLDPRYAVRQ
jgi:tetratricopeptide (TPR) repeat protein